MKIYEIMDSEENLSIGFLLYFEKKKEFIIELQEYLDEWSAPMLFSNLVKQGIRTMPRNLSYYWVKERIIPNDRQNISEILKNHKLLTYDEMTFLELSKGKCSQDSFYIQRVKELPLYIQTRTIKIIDCTPLENSRILCFFENGETKIIHLSCMTQIKDMEKILSNTSLFSSCMTGTGGYYITFNDSIDIPANILYESGETIPFSITDFQCFITNNLLDTPDSCNILNCSRQNLSYLTKQGKLTIAKENVNGNVYLKGNVLKNTW